MIISKKWTLRTRMIVGATAAVFFPFLVVGTIIYVQLSDALTKSSEKEAIHIAKDISSFINAILRQKLIMASSLAADDDTVQASKTGDYRVAQDELRHILERIGDDILTIYLTDRYGINRIDPRYPQQIGLDLSNREYFLKAKAGEANVMDPFIPMGADSPEKPIIVACAPIQEGADFLGIVSISFHTDFLLKQITSKKFPQTGHAYLINEEGLVLIHPQESYILKYRIFDQPGTKILERLVKSQETGTAFYSIEGSEYIAGVARMELTGWTVVFSERLEEITAPVNLMLSSVFLSGLIFLFIAISTIIIYFNWISNPIQKMVEMIDHVTQHSTEIILQIGLDRKISYVNQAFEKISSIRPKSVLGTEPDLTHANIPSDAIWAQLESGTPWSGRVLLEGNTSGPITLDVMFVPLRNNRGIIKSFLEIGRDVSKEIMFEKRLNQSQKLEAIGTLAGGIAHDFNNILGVIFSYAELMLMNNKGDPKTEKNIYSIIRASERARDLIAQILTFSQQTDVELKPLIPKFVLKEASKFLRASIPAIINIQLDLNSEATIMAGPTQLHQIVMNLFINAAQAIGADTGTIRLQLEDFQADKSFLQLNPEAQPGKHILLQVSDTGQGIEPEVLEQIFDPFFTTKLPGQGTGLGLSVVHGIVKKLNGIITVYSEVGHGTTFSIFIPCTDAVESSPNSMDLRIQGGTERLMLVDDEPALAASLEALLINIGYRVTVFTDSLAALETLTANPDNFDLVITDYSMPQITGIEIAKHIRHTGIDIPVILTSGYISVDIEKVTSEAGVSALISKPINTYRLARTIREIL
ncbi:MAG: cache domain-containing protein [Pseudomonadota bacterium]